MCYLKADKGKRTIHLMHLLPYISEPDDILMVNIGMHYNDMEDLADDMSMLGFALGQPNLPKHRIWVETSPQHYDTPQGGSSPSWTKVAHIVGGQNFACGMSN